MSLERICRSELRTEYRERPCDVPSCYQAYVWDDVYYEFRYESLSMCLRTNKDIPDGLEHHIIIEGLTQNGMNVLSANGGYLTVIAQSRNKLKHAIQLLVGRRQAIT